MKRLLKKAKLDIDAILKRLEQGEKITFKERSDEISFQEVRDALTDGDYEYKKTKNKELREKINKVRKELNQQYDQIKKDVAVYDIDNQPNVRKEKVMTIFAGPNGSGKSTITQLVRDQVGEVIDIDLIMKTQGIEFQEASLQAKNLAYEYIEKGVSFSIETTLVSNNAFEEMEEAKKQGYEVVAYYVGLMDVHMNVERVKKRVDKGGNYIPEDEIMEKYGPSVEHMKQLLDLADKAVAIDNSSSQPIAVAKFEKGKMIYHIDNENANWIEERLKE